MELDLRRKLNFCWKCKLNFCLKIFKILSLAFHEILVCGNNSNFKFSWTFLHFKQKARNELEKSSKKGSNAVIARGNDKSQRERVKKKKCRYFSKDITFKNQIKKYKCQLFLNKITHFRRKKKRRSKRICLSSIFQKLAMELT